jgi:hypothetical protein
MSTENNVEWKKRRSARKKSGIQLVLEVHVAHVRLFPADKKTRICYRT